MKETDFREPLIHGLAAGLLISRAEIGIGEAQVSGNGLHGECAVLVMAFQIALHL